MVRMESWGFLPLAWKTVEGTVAEIDRSLSLRLVRVVWLVAVMVVAQGFPVDSV